MISLQHVSKSYKSQGDVEALADINLEFLAGSVTTLFGPNGSGKSTLLELVCGLTKPNSGTVTFLRPEIQIGVVFQDFRNSLLPWLSIRKNILRPALWKKMPLPAVEQRLCKLLESFSINLPLDRYPHEVSGGQAQFACLLRALIVKPDVLVLDEPTSALDFELQWQAILQLERYWTEEKPAVILVSHDPEQALLAGDRVVVLHANPGRIAEVIQIDLPRPRTFSMISIPAFLRLRDELLGAFVQIPERSCRV